MSHSHIPVKHLLKSLEKKAEQPRRDVRPDWVRQLVNNLAELFEPFSDIGRVGFEARPRELLWEIGLYLGNTMHVGGKQDGRAEPVDFRFDLLRLHSILAPITRMQWNAFPADLVDDEIVGGTSFLVVEGNYASHPVRVRIFSTPPQDAGPGLKVLSDGTWEIA